MQPVGRSQRSLTLFMAELLLFCLAWLFPVVSAFSHFSAYIYSVTCRRPRRLKLSTKGRWRTQGGERWGWGGGSVPRRPLGSCLVMVSVFGPLCFGRAPPSPRPAGGLLQDREQFPGGSVETSFHPLPPCVVLSPGEPSGQEREDRCLFSRWPHICLSTV